MAGSTKISDYRFSIFINNDQAKRSLIEMEKVMQGYEAELAKLVNEKKQDTQEYRDAKKVYDDHLAQMKKLRQEAGLQALSVKELRQLQAQLNNEMARAIPGSPHRQKLQAELDAVGGRLKELTVKSKDAGFSFGRMADGFNKYFGVITAVAASLTGLVFSFRKVVDVFNEYEKKLDNLSALTGLTGDNLTWLSQKAKEMSIGVVEGNIRITQSADAIVDAYTKVGSARPELLKSKEDLNMVTQEAIILSEAANTELQPAVSALAGVLNQFNAPASDSRRIINALAAGSKEGAGEIPYLTEAIEKSGTVAADAGLSYEELIGTIETLAPRISQPEMAGRSLRAVILKLQEGANDTNPAIVGMATAMENLGKKNLSVTELVKIFGIENITAAKILINNVGELKKYTTAVTGTSVALEQASINTDNNSSKLAQAQNRVQLMSIELGEKLAPALTFSTNAFSYLMKAILGSISFFNEHKAAVLSAMIGVMAYTTVVYGVAAAKKVWAAATWLVDVAMKALKITTKANIWGVVIAGIASVTTFLLSYRKSIDETVRSQQRLNDLKKSFTDKLNDERVGLDLLYQAIKKTNNSSVERQNLIDAVNQRYGTTLKNIKDEKQFLDQLNGTYSNLISNMQKKALLESKEDALKQLYKERQDVLDKIKVANEAANKTYGLGEGVEVNVPGDTPEAKKAREQSLKDQNTYFSQLTLGAKVYKEELESVEKAIKDFQAFTPQDAALISSAPSGKDPGEGTGGGSSPDSEYEKNKKAAKEYSDYLLKIKKELEDAAIQLIKDAKEKELKLNELNYSRNIAEIKGMSADELKLRELYWLQSHDKEAEINKKYSDKTIADAIKIESEKWKAIIDADQKGSDQWLIDSLTLLKKQEELELSSLELTEQEKTDIVAKYEAKRREIKGQLDFIGPVQQKGKGDQASMLQTSGADKLGDLQLGQKRELLAIQRDMELASAQESADAQTEIWAQFHAAQLEATVSFINAAAQVASQVVSALSGVNQAMNDYENAQLKKDESANNQKKENLKKRLDSGKITQKQYNDGIAKLDAELDAKKKELAVKQGKRAKALAIAQAIINVAQGITSALAAGPFIGIVLAALVGILGAIQIGYMIATPVPEAAKGRYRAFLKARQAAMGRYDVLGQDDKKQYRGVPYIPQPDSGLYSTPTMFAETGREIILNPKHTENLIRFRPDLIQAIMQVPQRALGSYPVDVPETLARDQKPITIGFDADSLAAMKEFNDNMRRPVRAEMSYDHFVDSISKVQTIESEASR